jgi:hypothetical protein
LGGSITSGEAEIGRRQSEIGETEHGHECLTSGRSSEWLGAVSCELDGQGGGHGSPVRSGGVSRVRAGARLREMRWGSECGHGRGSKRSWGMGRVTWLRIPATCASARSLVHGLGQNGFFSFFLNFLIAFPFLFSRVFNPNSIQVSNSN